MTNENKAPERIWLGRDNRYVGSPWIRLASDFEDEDEDGATQEYVRADLFEASAAMASRQNALIDTILDEPAKSAKLVGALKACVSSLERANTAEGVCCCGDSMERHGAQMDCGHSPLDMGDYYASKALEAARAAIAAYEVKP